MENKLINSIKQDTNYSYTDNGAITHASTLNPVYDMFALCGSYRERTDAACIELFKNAFYADPVLAMKCLFWCRDARGGAGERRFFRVCMNWLARNGYAADVVTRNLPYISEFGRWDDLYCLMDTVLEKDVFDFITVQLVKDMNSSTPSLLAKWLPSENTSSIETRKLGARTRNALGMTAANYRRMLSLLRRRIKLVETSMSQNHWDEIEFDKLPSKAGFKYRKAFIRNRQTSERYAAFIKNKKTKVNAGVLFPYEAVQAAARVMYSNNEIERAAVNKYWDNFTNYFDNCTFNGLAVVDTSGSMMGTPIDVAISLGIYCAERAHGPFHNHFITFSSNPQLVELKGKDFVEKCENIYENSIVSNTNISAVFDLLLSTAIEHNLHQEDMPENIIILSDMQFDSAANGHIGGFTTNKFSFPTWTTRNTYTLMEGIRKTWEAAGYKLPHLIYWNLNGTLDNSIPDLKEGCVSYVSGFSPAIFKCLMTGKTGIDLMLETLNSERYSMIK